MRFEIIALLAAAATTSAQAVVGTAYGYGAGATGGGDAEAVTPKTKEELAQFLADDSPRTIVLDTTFDWTGETASGAGCDKSTCKASSGGQFYLGDLSCNSDEMTPTTVTYDKAGTDFLPVGSNKSILGVGGKGVIKGKGLSLQKNVENVIIQGVEFTTINPGVVWGGDALDMQGGNTKIWVDHCKFSTTGRMFIVSHYDGSSATLSNNEFDGVTDTSATCNGNHYWTMMFIGKNEKITMDKNYFHDVSGRAPKLGQDGVSGMFHAVNNYFENMKGHAFDAYTGANALVEGNAFVAVDQPNTEHAAGIATFVGDGGNACSGSFGRDCIPNSVDSASGKLAPGSSSGFIGQMGKIDVPEVLQADEVAAYVKSHAGPANLGSGASAPATNDKVVAPVAEQAADETDAAVEPIEPIASPTEPTVEEPESQVPGVAMPTGAAPQVPGAAMPTGAPGAPQEPAPEVPGAAMPTGAPSAPDSGSGGKAALYHQCGGSGYTGPTECEAPATCVKANEWYSQCINSSSKFRRAFRA
jgi:pectate lyase